MFQNIAIKEKYQQLKHEIVAHYNSNSLYEQKAVLLLFYSNLILFCIMSFFIFAILVGQIYCIFLINHIPFLFLNVISIFLLKNHKLEVAKKVFLLEYYEIPFFFLLYWAFTPIPAKFANLYVMTISLVVGLPIIIIVVYQQQKNLLLFFIGNFYLTILTVILALRLDLSLTSIFGNIINCFVLYNLIYFITQMNFEIFQLSFENLHQHAQQTQQLYEQIIEGFYPICSKCKKIRINNEWIQIEDFLTQKNESIQLTDQICSDCAQIIAKGGNRKNEQEN